VLPQGAVRRSGILYPGFRLGTPLKRKEFGLTSLAKLKRCLHTTQGGQVQVPAGGLQLRLAIVNVNPEKGWR
jgi:hypothetical protein